MPQTASSKALASFFLVAQHGYTMMVVLRDEPSDEGDRELMNAHAQWRLDFTHTLNTRFQQIDGIGMIAVLGSVARGYSDEYSELELMLLWNQALL